MKRASLIYLDFAKAFDSVPHRKPIYVLKALIFDKDVLN